MIRLTLSITTTLRSLGLSGMAERVLVLQERAQRRRRISFYSGFVHSGDLCYDIGANVGNRTDIFIRLGARVVAVEPQSECMLILRRKFGDQPSVILIRAGLDEIENGSRTIFKSKQSGISSMSEEWIKSVRTSGRFGNESWKDREQVAVTTLDALIAKYGLPSFCKIDVEGYELKVIRGLSKPIGVISFEFTPEIIQPAIGAIEHLRAFGSYKFNYSIGESMRLSLKNWINAQEVINHLITLKDKTIFGDIYASLYPMNSTSESNAPTED